MIFEIGNDLITAEISELGAELISVKSSEGFEYIWDADPDFWGSHAPLLFPVCGRLLNGKYLYGGKEFQMSAHGFAKNMRFRVKEHSSDRLVLSLKDNDESFEIYPFEFELIAEFTVIKNSLSVYFTVKNEGTAELPYMIGWHPGFNLWGDEKIGDFFVEYDKTKNFRRFPLQNGCFVCPNSEEYKLKKNRYYLCEEEIYRNDTMIFVGTGNSTTLGSKKTDRTVTVTYTENLPYLCLWKKNDSAARYICIEPWSDVPGPGDIEENFDTRKMSRLAPGKEERYNLTIHFS